MYSKYKTTKAKLILMSKGVAMGTADIIPGVSGGTIALISGIYDHFIGALDSIHLKHAVSLLQLLFFFWQPEKRRKALEELDEIEWQFLLPLFAGIVLALLVMIQIIPYLMEHYGFYAFSFFFGLILFSITVPYKRMEHRWQELLVLVSFACFTFLIVGMSRVSDARMEFVPDAVSNMQSEEAGNVILKTNQKGQWELRIPVESLLDAGDPRCPNFQCLLLPESGASELSLASTDRARVFTATVFQSSGERMGAFRLALAMPDLSRADYLRLADSRRTSTKAIRAVVLESDLGDLKVFIKKSNRKIQDEMDVLTIKGSIASEKGHSLWFLFLSGALAICAMVLPGISGAYILVLLGQYQYVTGLARNFLHNAKALLSAEHKDALLAGLGQDGLSLVVFVLGIGVGLFTFVRILKFVLSRYHSLTMAALTGLMIGSLRYIWPPHHFEGAAMSTADWGAFVGIALVGALAVYLLEFSASKLHDPDAPINERAP